MTRLLLICLAGALGTGCRYGAATLAMRWLGPSFPFGTLFVNVVGCFILGFVMRLGLSTRYLSPTARLTLGTGFCGGFTTYSSFNQETMAYLQQRAWLLAGVNVGVTLAAGMLAGLAGWAAAGAFLR